MKMWGLMDVEGSPAEIRKAPTKTEDRTKEKSPEESLWVSHLFYDWLDKRQSRLRT
jgi:hypothetical protein